MGWKATVKAAAAGDAEGGGDTGGREGPGAAPGIPAAMISRHDGMALQAALQTGVVLSARLFESPHCRRFVGGHREARAAAARGAQRAVGAKAQAATVGEVVEAGQVGQMAEEDRVAAEVRPGGCLSTQGNGGVEAAPRAAAPGAIEALLPPSRHRHRAGWPGAISGRTAVPGGVPLRQLAPLPPPPVRPWPLYVPVTQPVSFAWPEKAGGTRRVAGGGWGGVRAYVPILGEVPPADVQRAGCL